LTLPIEDTETERIVRELASLTGETVTLAIRRAVEERLHRLRRERGLAAGLLEIGKRCASLPDLDTRTTDEILRYDEHGLPN